ncbi:hypothetical protein FA10DRAFT_175872 [Acaromyces ingoldii]|uniref:Uncharacterized protein n=1 Tax=Acaromyces ingoldii TaxID=215250 RepID=A0A316YJ57_9BASI|nr:hypothetical protein FA10DRAFT_175872 [Acaromyces ingoldii]PWN87755.1 hypothetical protein FA10DRAFT_175872 [Acaromyces ingoldii]
MPLVYLVAPLVRCRTVKEEWRAQFFIFPLFRIFALSECASSKSPSLRFFILIRPVTNQRMLDSSPFHDKKKTRRERKSPSVIADEEHMEIAQM